jgi:hypothetical protein
VLLARTRLPGLSSRSMLTDIVIHQMDILHPVHLHRSIPDRRMILVASDLWTNGFFPGRKLFEGLRATATDAEWTAGDGIDIAGPIEPLVLTLAGRLTALDQLHGDGIATLRLRAAAILEQGR